MDHFRNHQIKGVKGDDLFVYMCRCCNYLFLVHICTCMDNMYYIVPKVPLK